MPRYVIISESSTQRIRPYPSHSSQHITIQTTCYLKLFPDERLPYSQKQASQRYTSLIANRYVLRIRPYCAQHPAQSAPTEHFRPSIECATWCHSCAPSRLPARAKRYAVCVNFRSETMLCFHKTLSFETNIDNYRKSLDKVCSVYYQLWLARCLVLRHMWISTPSNCTIVLSITPDRGICRTPSDDLA